MRSWVLRWGPMVLIMAVIFVFSSFPQAALPQPESNLFNILVKKSAHFFIFGALAASVLWGRFALRDRLALRDRFALRDIGGRDMVLAVVVAALYGISDEFHQTFVPGRMATLLDILIDVAGALVAVIVFWRLQHKLGSALAYLEKIITNE